MEDKKTYAIGYGGYEDRCVWYASSEEEVKADYRKMLIDSGMEEDEIPSLEEIHAEELAGYVVSFGEGIDIMEEVSFIREALRHVPSGFQATTDDEDHTYTTERFWYNGRKYLLNIHVTNWETDWGFDPDGEYGSYDVESVEVQRW